MLDHRGLSDDLGFSCFLQSSATDSSRGIVILWKDDLIDIKDISISFEAIHATVKVSFSRSCWILSVIYASNVFFLRKSLWDQLMYVVNYLHTLESDIW